MISLSVGHLKQDQKNKDAMLANILITYLLLYQDRNILDVITSTFYLLSGFTWWRTSIPKSRPTKTRAFRSHASNGRTQPQGEE